MLAGITGALSLICCGVALLLRRPGGSGDGVKLESHVAGESQVDLESRIDLESHVDVESRARSQVAFTPRRLIALVALLLVALFCGWQLQLLFNTCQGSWHGRFRVEGEQYKHLLALHGVLIVGLATAAVGLARECTLPRGGHERWVGLAGVFGMGFGINAIRLTFPASVYGAQSSHYSIMMLLVAVPVGVLLSVASLFLLFRPKHGFIPIDESAHPLCSACGYNLTGNVSGRCPECGTRVNDSPPSPLHAIGPRPFRLIALSCCIFALFCLVLLAARTVVARCGAMGLDIPIVEFWAVFYDQGPWSKDIPVRIYLQSLVVGVLAIGAVGLGWRRRWGVGVLWCWLVVWIVFSLLDAARHGASQYYSVSPGFHWDFDAMRVAFVRAFVGAAFPMFLAIWLSQRQVRQAIKHFR